MYRKIKYEVWRVVYAHLVTCKSDEKAVEWRVDTAHVKTVKARRKSDIAKVCPGVILESELVDTIEKNIEFTIEDLEAISENMNQEA